MNPEISYSIQSTKNATLTRRCRIDVTQFCEAESFSEYLDPMSYTLAKTGYVSKNAGNARLGY
jgi:hypothetical protein